MTFGVEGGVPRALSIKERCLLNCFAWDKERDCFAPKRGRERAGRPGGGQGGGEEGVQPQCNSREMSATWWNPLWDEQIFGKYTECLACVVILQSLVTKLSLVRILKLNTASGVFSFRNSDILFLLQAVWFCLSLSSSLSQDRQTDRQTDTHGSTFPQSDTLLYRWVKGGLFHHTVRRQSECTSGLGDMGMVPRAWAATSQRMIRQ